MENIIQIKEFSSLEDISEFLNVKKINNFNITREYIDLKLEDFRIDYASQPETKYILIYKTNEFFIKKIIEEYSIQEQYIAQEEQKELTMDDLPF